MCLLIKQPKGITFSRTEVADFHDYNSDGFGIMYGDGKRLHIAKVYGTLQDVQAVYDKVGAGRECVLHFRMATHGTKGLDNAHPFHVTERIGMAHNGILDIGNPIHASKTDTEHLIRYFIRPVALMDENLLFDPKWLEMLGDLIGKSNRLAFAHADGRIALVNESTGTKHKGAWMSNTYAWSAPGKPKASSRTHGAYTYRELWEDPNDEMETASQRDDAPYTWESDFRETREQGGTIALAEAMSRYPEGAGLVIADYYQMTPDEATDFVREHLAGAVSTMEEILDASDDDTLDDEQDAPLGVGA